GWPRGRFRPPRRAVAGGPALRADPGGRRSDPPLLAPLYLQSLSADPPVEAAPAFRRGHRAVPGRRVGGGLPQAPRAELGGDGIRPLPLVELARARSRRPRG